jgi:ABC-type branched-subunit amino acid transport system substrate-binding protein
MGVWSINASIGLACAGITSDMFALLSYDAIWALAHAMHATQQITPAFSPWAFDWNSSTLMHQLQRVRYFGASGVVELDSNLDRSNMGYDIIRYSI